VGSPQRAWVFVTSTGTPRAAQTLLKFTPAAITRTRTSWGPISGTSITSSRIASAGSPYRSGRTSCACILGGTSPTGGISPISYRSLPTLSLLDQPNERPEGRAGREPPEGRRAPRAPTNGVTTEGIGDL